MWLLCNLVICFFSAKAVANPLPFLVPEHRTQWLKLGHYQKSIFGNYYSNIQGDQFFISADGRTNPDQELQATIDKMRGPEFEKYQCRYLARRDFIVNQLQQNLPQIAACAKEQDWVARVGADSLTLIFASAYMGNVGSSFGHTFLKLHRKNNSVLTDYGINFAARTGTAVGALYALYGLFGMYPGNFGMLPYHQMIQSYTHVEGRDIWEYDLNFSQEEIRRLIFHLLELDNSSFAYYFLSDNCSYQILKVLEVARPGLELANELHGWVIPMDTVKVLNKKKILLSPRYRPSEETLFAQSYFQLNAKEKSDFKLAVQSLSVHSTLSTRTIESLQAYSASQELKNPEKWKSFTYKLAQQRSRQEPIESKPIAEPQSPESSPESSQVFFGNKNQSNKNYLRLGFQFGYHDFISSDYGVSPVSQMQNFRLDAQTTDNANWKINEIKILDFLSTQSWQDWDRPLSLQGSLGAQSFKEDLQLHPYLKAGLGIRKDLFETLQSIGLVTVNIEENMDAHTEVNPGLRFLLRKEWDKFGITAIDYELKWQQNNPPQEQIKFQYAKTWNAHLETLLERTETWSKNQSSQDFSLLQKVFFIF